MKTLFSAFTILFFLSQCGYAQFDLLEKIKEKVEEKVEEKTDEAIDKGLEKAEEEVTQKTEEKPEEDTGEEDPAPSKKPAKPALQKYSIYDFIPGDKVVFFEDFSQDNIGDFPALWFTNKGGEVVNTNNYPGKWFQMNDDGSYFLEKGFSFPENFTLEFDVIPSAFNDAQSAGLDITLFQIEEDDKYPTTYVPGVGGLVLTLFTPNGYHTIEGYYNQTRAVSGEYTKESGLLKRDEINHVCIWIQKTRCRVYLQGEKVFDLPKVISPSTKFDQLRFWIENNQTPLITNIRIAEAGGDMRSKLLSEGKLVTRGITFDTNSDKIKPESYGILREIAKVLNDNKDVKIQIVGHTDSDGSDAANLDLSKRRSASVKNSLSKDFGVDASRMQTDGKGESVPCGENNTKEGKANNRRVEFIKL